MVGQVKDTSRNPEAISRSYLHLRRWTAWISDTRPSTRCSFFDYRSTSCQVSSKLVLRLPSGYLHACKAWRQCVWSETSFRESNSVYTCALELYFCTPVTPFTTVIERKSVRPRQNQASRRPNVLKPSYASSPTETNRTMNVLCNQNPTAYFQKR